MTMPDLGPLTNSLASLAMQIETARLAVVASRQDRIVVFPANGTQAQFLGLVADMTIAVIEMAAGKHIGWDVWINIDRTSRPLLVRPAPGAAVVWDNQLAPTGDGIFYFGFNGNGKAAHITFDPAGTGGSFTIQNVRLNQTGLVCTAYVDTITMNAFRVRGCIAVSGASGQNEHAVYVSSDGVHRGANVTFNDWDVDSGDGKFNPDLQIFHGPSCDGITALRWRSDGTGGAIKGFYAGGAAATGVLVDGWTMINLVRPFISVGASGIVQNCHATGSGAPQIYSPMVNGGGNVWN